MKGQTAGLARGRSCRPGGRLPWLQGAETSNPRRPSTSDPLSKQGSPYDAKATPSVLIQGNFF